MARSENQPLLVGLTQYLEPTYWAWAANDPAAAVVLDQGATVLLAHLVERLEAGGVKVADAYGIVHDKDTRSVWDPATAGYVLEVKPPHLHAVFKFATRSDSAAISVLAGLLGVESQYVEKPGRGRFAYDNMLSYLVHVKYTDKHQYDPSEVATVRGRPYPEIAAERWPVWLKGRASVEKKAVELEKDSLLADAIYGRISKQQVLLTDEMYRVYARYQREFDDAFAAFGQRRAMLAADKLEKGDFATTIIYVYGSAGIGKTSWVKHLIAGAVQYGAAAGQSWSVYRAATLNPLDDWVGEEIVLLDDLRPGAMSANDWLLLLDPYNASPAKARYKNKLAVAPRLIVMTATVHPVDFFYFAAQKGEVNEALDQFLRRLTRLVRVFRTPSSSHLEYAIGTMQKTGLYTREIELLRKSDYDPRTAKVMLSYDSTCPVIVGESAATAAVLDEIGRRGVDLHDWPPLDPDASWELHQAELEANPALNDFFMQASIAELHEEAMTA